MSRTPMALSLALLVSLNAFADSKPASPPPGWECVAKLGAARQTFFIRPDFGVPNQPIAFKDGKRHWKFNANQFPPGVGIQLDLYEMKGTEVARHVSSSGPLPGLDYPATLQSDDVSVQCLQKNAERFRFSCKGIGDNSREVGGELIADGRLTGIELRSLVKGIQATGGTTNEMNTPLVKQYAGYDRYQVGSVMTGKSASSCLRA